MNKSGDRSSSILRLICYGAAANGKVISVHGLRRIRFQLHALRVEHLPGIVNGTKDPAGFWLRLCRSVHTAGHGPPDAS